MTEISHDNGPENPDEIPLWTATVAHGRYILGNMSDSDNEKIRLCLRRVAVSIRPPRRKPGAQYHEPRLETAHATLRFMKFSLDHNGRGSISYFFDDLEEQLRHGRHGIVTLRLILRGLFRNTAVKGQPMESWTVGSMRRVTLRAASLDFRPVPMEALANP